MTTTNEQATETSFEDLTLPLEERVKRASKAASTVQVTAAELTALKECLNYQDLEEQLSDNFSNGGVAEFKHALTWNAQQVGGLITSMTEKGLGYMDEEGNDIFWLSDLGAAVALRD